VTTETTELVISGIAVQVVRKNIKNMHLAVYPPDGRVRVSAPTRVSDETVRLAVISRLNWIRKRQQTLEQQLRQGRRLMVTGESHFVEGRRYRLDVTESDSPAAIELRNRQRLHMSVRPGTSPDKRLELLQQWYRRRLQARLPSLLEKWEPLIGVSANECRIKRMKTRWGTCNIDARRIWLNLELAKKPPECLEYILVHELVHLRERHHNDRFKALMDRYLPTWRLCRDRLNQAPLADERWDY